MKQKTISQDCTLSGVGIHSGKTATLRFIPSESKGIVFQHKDNPKKTLNVHPNHIGSTPRATQLTNNTISIATPEHLLSACAGLGIDNLIIEIDAEEIPIFDGSALPFITAFQKAGIHTLDAPKTPIIISTPLHLSSKESSIIITPSEHTIFSYYLHYDHPVIGTQSVTFTLTEETYIQEIAPARTYGFEHEVAQLLEQGLAQGGSLDNALIIGDTQYINPPRFSDECARHKLLDLMGDLWILNAPIQGHVVGIKSGHALNTKAAQEIATLMQ